MIRFRMKSRSVCHLPLLLLLLLAVLLPASAATAEEGAEAGHDAAAAVAAALALHEEATDFAGEQKALDAFELAVEHHPDDFHANFWLAYLETQVARLVLQGAGEGDGPALLDSAQAHIDHAGGLLDAAEGDHARERSSLEALQHLTYLFRANSDQEAAAEWQEKRDQALKSAIVTDPTNPVVWILTGTGMASQARQAGDPGGLIAAHALLLRAQEAASELEEAGKPRSETTFFNSEWLPFWLPRLEQAIGGLGQGGGA